MIKLERLISFITFRGHESSPLRLEGTVVPKVDKGELEAKLKSELEVKIRAELEAEVRIEIEARIKAEAEAARVKAEKAPLLG